MSVYRRKGSPYYQIEFVLNGQLVRRSSKAVSRREAQAVERELRAEVAKQQGKPHRESLTLDQAAGRWWEEHGHTLRSKSHAVYTHQILDGLGRDHELGDIRTSDIDDAVRRWRAAGDGPANIGRRLAVLRSILRRSDRIWGVPVNQIAWPSVTPKEPPGRVRWLTPDEARLLVAAAETNGHQNVALAIRWSIATGCRRSETFGLRWGDVRLDRGSCTVSGKTGPRVVWLSLEARQVLASCSTSAVQVFDGTGLRTRFGKAVKGAGLVDFRWHDLRHTHASWMRQAGVPLEVVQRSLGHQSIITTTRYAHVEDREVVRAVDGLPSLTAPPENVVRLKKIERS